MTALGVGFGGHISAAFAAGLIRVRARTPPGIWPHLFAVADQGRRRRPPLPLPSGKSKAGSLCYGPSQLFLANRRPPLEHRESRRGSTALADLPAPPNARYGPASVEPRTPGNQ